MTCQSSESYKNNIFYYEINQNLAEFLSPPMSISILFDASISTKYLKPLSFAASFSIRLVKRPSWATSRSINLASLKPNCLSTFKNLSRLNLPYGYFLKLLSLIRSRLLTGMVFGAALST
ncbi:hypothetical protein BpHYR1_017593 [Brachionus plicatilis]|uniref:Uncharacterized protein n=1 Tax=Brachionus plicatilis TaxID=10195 RepID=A0A3M7SDD6_BRAPC|nr:hypothetical protein BpHYR1_017593 [Brachionus plicatilis]